MGDPLKLILSSSIKALEQGAFQEFCLSFLPTYDDRFEGLERRGGTANGKTRAGTPDLLKTYSDGSQLAVQCSVVKDYWACPKDKIKIESCKPCSEIRDCVKELDKLQEIVLCSSQEVPTNNPNAESQIIEFAKSKTEAGITIFTLTRFEEEIINNVEKYESLIKRHLPYFHEYAKQARIDPRASAAEITLDIYERHSVPLEQITNIVTEVMASSSKGVDLRALVVERVNNLKSRFERPHLPESPQVKRISGKEYFSGSLIGHIYSMVGVPKIGKTSYIAQVCSELDRSQTEILWFDPPILPEEQDEFYRELCRAVLSRLVTPLLANEFAEGKISLDVLSNALSNADIHKDIQVVIDDAQYLSRTLLSKIDILLKTIKSSPRKSNLGMVFISNRSLKENVSQLDNEHMSPIWDEVELQNLIKHNQIKIQGSLEEYTRLLAAFSGGHPLVAIALARKAPSINLLVSNQLTKTPALEDEDLTVEVTNLLFNELLVDQDLRDFVLRISILVYPADILLLDFLSRKVSPALRTPSTLMTDRLKGTILEGDPKKGLQVAFVFRKVAADYISVDQRKEIFEHTSIFLLTPKNNVINADEAIQGIMYALLSHNLRRAFAWALMLLLEIPKLSNDQTTYLIDRLFFIEALKMPEAADVRIYYQITLLQIATGYSRIGKRKRCIEILNRILAHKVDISETPAALPIPIDQIYESFKMYLALELGLNQDFSHALQMLDQIDPRNLPLGDMDVNLIQVASDLVARGKPSEFPKNFLYRRVKTTTPAEDTVIGQLAVSFLKLGVLLSKEGSSVDLKKTLEVEDESPPVLWDLLSEMTRAQIELQRRNSEESIKILDGIMEKVSEAGIASNTLKAKVLIVKGDAFYLMHQDQNARVNYVKALKFLPGDQVLFDRAWANYRIGLCTTNAQEAISALSDASQQFNLLGYRYQAALSDGEKAVALYKAGKLYESVLEFEGLAKEYYLNGQMEYAPAVTIALALVGRIQSELEKKPVPTDASGKPIFPPFERGIFGKVAEHAKPNPGQCAAFYTLGEVYELLGKKDRKIEALKLSVSGSPKADLDVKVRVLAGLELIYELTLAGALEGVANAVKNLFHSTTGQEFRSEDFWVFATFTKIEVLLKEGRFHKEGYLKLLDVFEDATSCLSGKRKSWWLAEIYKRKAGIDSVTSPTELKPNYLIKALDHSQKSENYSVLLEVSQSMGYPSKPIARSIRELARIHSLIVLAICNDGGEIERLRSVGSNLVKIWPALEYRRLSEDDLPYWKNLRDRATEFEKKNVPPDLRPPLMVLLLLSVNTVKKNEKYKKAIDWAYATIGDKCGEIPQDVREYLDA